MMATVVLLICSSVAEVHKTEEGREGEALGATAHTSNSRLWADGRVRWVMGSGLSDSDSRILWAIDEWESKSCIRFTRCSSEASCSTPYIVFRAGNVCSSPVGTYRGSVNRINLARGCSRVAAAHEIGHSLGLLHEQSRNDRDEHVTVNYDNIQSDHSHNFDKSGRNGRDIEAYDYNSIMHYSAYAFSSGGKTIDAPKPIGRSRGLSERDVKTIDFMYNSCSNTFSQPRCVESRDNDEVLSVGEPWTVEFNVRYSGRMTVTRRFTAPASRVVEDRVSTLGETGKTRMTFTPSAADRGSTFTFQATFTGRDQRSSTCSVRVRVQGSAPPGRTPAPRARTPAPPGRTPPPPRPTTPSPPRRSTVNIAFECRNGQTFIGQSVYVVGNTPELGNWSPARAVLLKPDRYPTWSGTIKLPARRDVEWKCIKRLENDPSQVVWQTGSNNKMNTGSSSKTVAARF